MFALFFFALLASAYCCENGTDIVSIDVKNYNEIIGKWTFAYHWDNNLVSKLVPKEQNPLTCETLDISVASTEFKEEMKNTCAHQEYPFNWDDSMFILNAPFISNNDSVIVIGEKDNWMVVDCIKIVRVVMKKVGDDNLVMTNPDSTPDVAELLVKKTPSLDELKCIANNIDIAKGLEGISLCYKEE